MARRRLLAIVDPKDPFMPGELAGEDLPGPILSVMDARRFDQVHLFHTPGLRGNAEETAAEAGRRHGGCVVSFRALPVADPKDYSSIMGSLAREVRRINREAGDDEISVCVSSGTAEMRAAWFLLAASGVLTATLLQVGSPAEPLFGAANVKEVELGSSDWNSLRDLIMPVEYFTGPAPASPPLREEISFAAAEACLLPAEPPELYDELEPALLELGIFIGSAVLRRAAEQAAIAGESDYPVLVLGETGSGKEMFAKLVHRLSPRRHEDLVVVNCAAIPKELVESHLFGHVKGAFTGATSDLKGKFQRADGGTLFLDEIGELTPDAQVKLLRVLQDGKVEQVGSERTVQVDVRIVAATNRSLAEEVAAGRFRKDLYYRLEVIQISIPPLRERRGEIPKLALALLQRINHRRKQPRQLSKEALERLEAHSWPGNVRELSNVLDRSVLYSRNDVLGPGDLLIGEKPAGPDPLSTLPEPCDGFSLEDFLAAARRQLMLRALAKANGNQSAAADLLGISKQAVSKFVKGQAGKGG